MTGTTGVFGLFKIGIGPSSSHTIGPMLAARDFIIWAGSQTGLDAADRVTCELVGSLSATGRGHGTDLAVTLGFLGCVPDSVTAGEITSVRDNTENAHAIALGNGRTIPFLRTRDVIYLRRKAHAYHPNAMTFRLFAGETELAARTYFSIGGGFIEVEGETATAETEATNVPYPIDNAADLIAHTDRTGLEIADIVLANETAFHDPQSIHTHIGQVWETMKDSVASGLKTGGSLPGPMQVRRRAAAIHDKLTEAERALSNQQPTENEWVSLWAIAVNETNASFGRVVTAPTNGAAGIIPAVLHYYQRFIENASPEGVTKFILTATAFGWLLKHNASISGADVGCQGEVGSAAAMAAAGLTACLGGTSRQIENAAEIALEHHLGMTCDPIGGLVQIPCIERNAMAANKAISAARLSLLGDGTHYVSFDQVVKTMLETGRDMNLKYKETSTGGLAVNVPLC